LTSNSVDIGKAFRKAAEKALMEWHADQWDRQKDELDDLVQDLWVWYLESKGTQAKLNTLSQPEVVETVRQVAIQKLSKQVLESNTFQGKDLYSSDSVKEALAGKSTNKYLLTALPQALATVDSRNPAYAEAIRSRYEDGVVPPQGAGHRRLNNALTSLRAEVNVVYLTADEADIGSRHSVFPQTRKQKGEHSDPTGNTAILLMENPEIRQDYLEQTPITDLIDGQKAAPAYELEGNKRFRPTGEEAAALRKHPQLVEPLLSKKREKWC
jgi:hypothetical protein